MDKNLPMPSLLRGFHNTASRTVAWEEVFRIITGDTLKENTERFRATGDTRYKARTLCTSVAVQFNGTGKQETDIAARTGVGMADFDCLPPEVMDKCGQLLKEDPHAFLVYRTISGRGYRVLFRYDPPTDHATAFLAANCHFADLIGFPFDPVCSDLTRISALCHDPEASFNPDAEPFGTADQEVAYTYPLPTAGHPLPEDPIAFAVEVTERHGYRYAKGSRNDYLMRCLMFMNKLGVSRTDAERWATGHDLPPKEALAIVRSCYSHTAQHATFDFGRRSASPHRLQAAAAHPGGTIPVPPEESGDNRQHPTRKRVNPAEIAAFLGTRAAFRMNVISDQTEIQWHGQTWQPMTDRDVSTLWMHLCRSRIPGNEQQINSVIQSDFTPLFHPFQAYFESLKPWDGVTDHIGRLAARVTLADETPQLRQRFTTYLRKWLVALVAGIFRPEVVNHEILVLVGRQGNYKSTFFAHLLPPELQCYFYVKLNAEQVNKDDLFTLTQYALIAYEEIDTMRPTDLNRLKALTTMRDINERRAYGRHKEHRNHIASFCATGNNPRFLSDRTGTRRWLTFEVDRILSPVEHPFDYEGIYSQVWHLFRSGFEYWFSGDEIGELNDHNTCFEAPCLEEDLILQHYCVPLPGMTSELVSTARILECINALLRQPLSAQKVGTAMKRLGFESVRTRQGMRYRVHVLTPDEAEAVKREEARRYSPEQASEGNDPHDDEPKLPF